MKTFLTSSLVAAAMLASVPATAQEQVCGEREIIVHQLENKHGEFRRSVGLQDNMVVVEVFASEHGTWTILFTKPTGISCFMAVGRSWETELAARSTTQGTAL